MQAQEGAWPLPYQDLPPLPCRQSLSSFYMAVLSVLTQSCYLVGIQQPMRSGGEGEDLYRHSNSL